MDGERLKGQATINFFILTMRAQELSTIFRHSEYNFWEKWTQFTRTLFDISKFKKKSLASAFLALQLLWHWLCSATSGSDSLAVNLGNSTLYLFTPSVFYATNLRRGSICISGLLVNESRRLFSCLSLFIISFEVFIPSPSNALRF